MTSIIEKLKSSGKKLLEAQAEGIELWKQMKHNKKDLELFLQFNVAELRFKPKDDPKYRFIVCTSNTRLIAVFQALKEFEKKKVLKTVPFAGIRTKNSTSIMTFNLIANSYNTIPLRAWQLGNFVTLSEKNIPIIDTMLYDLLKRKEKTEKKDNRLFFK